MLKAVTILNIYILRDQKNTIYSIPVKFKSFQVAFLSKNRIKKTIKTLRSNGEQFEGMSDPYESSQLPRK
jgi:hypothetical protein